MDHIRRVVIGLGSNIGDRADQIAKAIDALRLVDSLHLAEVSPLYLTAAEPPIAAGMDASGAPIHAEFVNGAVLVLTSIEARELLERLHTIESNLGRVRSTPNAPRTIDLDILWIEGECIREPDLVVPHARLALRAFMLRPLLDVAPDARDAESGQVFGELPLASTELQRLG